MKVLTTLLLTLAVVTASQSQSCLPEGFVFNTQTQVDNFQVSYPGCREIMGDVRISGDNINNLNGLNILTYIGGNLEINTTHYLPALQGLDNLVYIGGDLIIFSNYALTGLIGLQGLVTVEGTVAISNNPVLASISALSNLDATSIADLAIHDNPVLADCAAQCICDYLGEPNGHVDIYNNAPGCENPPDIAEHCGITLSCLPHGDYYFLSQTDIDNFATDYSGCASLAGITTISGEDISSLGGLSGVTSMGMYVRIEGNSVLQNLSGLEGLTAINGSLSVSFNDALTSLAGLENIDPGSFDMLILVFNPELSECDVLSICEFIDNQGGIIQVTDNASGCNSQQEVLDACAVGIEDKVTAEPLVLIYPNPASDVLFIESSEEIIYISIFNGQGEEVRRRRGEGVTWGRGEGERLIVTLQGLAPGLYLVRVETESGVFGRKVVVR